MQAGDGDGLLRADPDRLARPAAGVVVVPRPHPLAVSQLADVAGEGVEVIGLGIEVGERPPHGLLAIPDVIVIP